MNSNIIAIMKKEFARFFKDKRMVITTIFMPGIMIYVMYSIMGPAMASLYNSGEDFVATVYVEELPEFLAEQQDLPIEFVETQDTQAALDLLEEGSEECDLLAVFPEDFSAQVEAYQVSEGQKAPEVELYYNSTVTDSSTAYDMMVYLLEEYESSLSNKFDVNSQEQQYDLASQEDTVGMLFGMLVPMLMMMFLFSGCMAVAPEAIAGEKERGTIATLLVTPMKRSHLAVGKIVSLSCIAILSGCSSFLGTMLSMPKLIGGEMEGISASVYQISDYLQLLFVILSTVLVLVTLIALLSAVAKTIKEANTWISVMMILVMVIGISSMIDAFKPTSLAMYLIPLYNSVQCMGGIFSFSLDGMAVLVTVAANVVYMGVGAALLTVLFNSEKAMFSK